MDKGTWGRILLGLVAVIVVTILLFGCKPAPEPQPDGPPAVVHVTTTGSGVLAG